MNPTYINAADVAPLSMNRQPDSATKHGHQTFGAISRHLISTLGLAVSAVNFIAPCSFAAQVPQPVTVQVVNTAAQAVPVKLGDPVQVVGAVETINDALRAPYHQHATALLSVSDVGTEIFYFPVPAGKRLIVETVSARAFVPPGVKVGAEVGINQIPSPDEYEIPMHSNGVFDAGEWFAGTQPLKLRVDSLAVNPSASIYVRVSTSNLNGGGTVTASVSGYLVDL